MEKMKTQFLVFYAGGPLFLYENIFDPEQLIFLPLEELSQKDRQMVNLFLSENIEIKQDFYERLEMVDDSLRASTFYSKYINENYAVDFNDARLIGCVADQNYKRPFNRLFFVMRKAYFRSDIMVGYEQLVSFLNQKFKNSITVYPQ